MKVKIVFGYLVVLVVLQQACKTPATNTATTNTSTTAKETSAAPSTTGVNSLDQFLSDFESMVLQHNTSTILNFLDKDYKKEQYEKQMKSNTDSFLNRFFSNNEMKGNAYTIVFKNIVKITRIESKFVSGYYTVTYKVSTKDATVTLPLMVFTRLEGTEVKYAFYGPVGS